MCGCYCWPPLYNLSQCHHVVRWKTLISKTYFIHYCEYLSVGPIKIYVSLLPLQDMNYVVSDGTVVLIQGRGPRQLHWPRVKLHNQGITGKYGTSEKDTGCIVISNQLITIPWIANLNAVMVLSFNSPSRSIFLSSLLGLAWHSGQICCSPGQ